MIIGSGGRAPLSRNAQASFETLRVNLPGLGVKAGVYTSRSVGRSGFHRGDLVVERQRETWSDDHTRRGVID